MTRAFLIVMDSVGCGGAPDAADFGDAGANTLGHIALACAERRADQGRSGPLHLPNLDALGLGAAIELASGLKPPGLGTQPKGRWGAATEVSRGKDTPSGHWELAGVPVRRCASQCSAMIGTPEAWQLPKMPVVPASLHTSATRSSGKAGTVSGK